MGSQTETLPASQDYTALLAMPPTMSQSLISFGLEPPGPISSQLIGDSQQPLSLSQMLPHDIQPDATSAQALPHVSAMLTVPQLPPPPALTSMGVPLAMHPHAHAAAAQLFSSEAMNKAFGMTGPAFLAVPTAVPQQLEPVDKGPQPKHPSLLKPEHKNSKAHRRGPMDEMRQLIRIMVKLLPDSQRYLTADEGGGGNRVSEEQIKEYLHSVLGAAHEQTEQSPPLPEWGLQHGWGDYLAQLFMWAKGMSDFNRQDAMKCAQRLPGRSWEAVDSELVRQKLCPSAWPLPLKRDGVRKVQKVYEETGSLSAAKAVLAAEQAAAPAAAAALGGGAQVVMLPAGAAPNAASFNDVAMALDGCADAALAGSGPGSPGAGSKRPASDGQDPVVATAGPGPGSTQLYVHTLPASAAAPAAKRRKRAQQGTPLDSGTLTELESWHLALKYLQSAAKLSNTTPPDQLGDLLSTRDAVHRTVTSLCRTSVQMPAVAAAAAAAAADPAGALNAAAMVLNGQQLSALLGSRHTHTTAGGGGGPSLYLTTPALSGLSLPGLGGAAMQLTQPQLPMPSLVVNPSHHHHAASAPGGPAPAPAGTAATQQAPVVPAAPVGLVKPKAVPAQAKADTREHAPASSREHAYAAPLAKSQQAGEDVRPIGSMGGLGGAFRVYADRPTASQDSRPRSNLDTLAQAATSLDERDGVEHSPSPTNSGGAGTATLGTSFDEVIKAAADSAAAEAQRVAAQAAAVARASTEALTAAHIKLKVEHGAMTVAGQDQAAASTPMPPTSASQELRNRLHSQIESAALTAEERQQQHKGAASAGQQGAAQHATQVFLPPGVQLVNINGQLLQATQHGANIMYNAIDTNSLYRGLQQQVLMVSGGGGVGAAAFAQPLLTAQQGSAFTFLQQQPQQVLTMAHTLPAAQIIAAACDTPQQA